MSVQRKFKLPGAIQGHRLRVGMSQKKLALSIGVDQSVLCAVEKGRRQAPPDEFLVRFAQALELDESQKDELIWLAEHDRLIREVARGPCPVATNVVSAAFWAVHGLSPLARDGLVTLLTRKAESAADVRHLESLSHPLDERGGQ
jgi:transcriptional regulator with XRE-family HTH domain